ncbi:MAG TPA: metal-dependent hydrolase, partial [Gemmataceae bacterium]|nr:metal-dependent hydrolase [Gemmataceae bacterium]
SDSGRPVKELFGVTATIVPFLLLHRLIRAGLPTENIILIGIGLYLGIRFGAAWLFKHLTVHRGMFHSIPAAAIAAELAFLADNGAPDMARWAVAGGVFLGYVSHLVLDEVYSIDARGLKIRKSAGSPEIGFDKPQCHRADLAARGRADVPGRSRAGLATALRVEFSFGGHAPPPRLSLL